MALVTATELAWALDIPESLAEVALARIRARQLHEPPPPLPPPSLVSSLTDERRVRWANE
jgi:hypothetical protein